LTVGESAAAQSLDAHAMQLKAGSTLALLAPPNIQVLIYPGKEAATASMQHHGL